MSADRPTEAPVRIVATGRPRHALPPPPGLFSRCRWMLGWAYLFSPAVMIVVILLVVLTGCTIEVQDPSADTASSEASKPTAPTPSSDMEEGVTDIAFLTLVRDERPAMFRGVDNDDVVELARMVCTLYDSGADFVEIAGMGIKAGYSAMDFGYFMGASVAMYCPEYSDSLG